MLFNIKPYEKKIFDLISETGKELNFPVYVIGGYVRDRILDRISNDMDIVCVGNGIEFAQALASKMRPIPRVVYYHRFGTAMLKHKDLEIEFVGARKESYRSYSRKPIVENGSLIDDQLRRDFTINALSVSLNEGDFGKIIDPFNGLDDITSKTIRTPLEAGRTFTDDPLRMLRAVRFASQLDFQIEPKTMKALGQYKDRIKIVSKERVTGELMKMMMSPKPSVGFNILLETGLLELILPEMIALQGVEIRNGVGHKDNYHHTLEVLDNLCVKSDNVWLRWAALLHDIAKPPTKRFDKEHGWTFHGHDALGAMMVPDIFKRLRLPLDHKMKYVQKMVRLHLRPISLTKEEITDSAIRRLLFEAGDDIDDLMMLCEADITSKNPNRVARYLQNYEVVREKLVEVEESDKLRNFQPPITGQLIMETFDLKPGPQVGVLKETIREAILDGLIPNDFDKAYQFMLKEAEKMELKKR